MPMSGGLPSARRRLPSERRRGRPAIWRTGPGISISCGLVVGSEADDVLGRRALLALDDVELDALTLGEVLEPRALDRRMVDETVLLAILAGDESEALRLVEPLDRAFGTHVLPAPS